VFLPSDTFRSAVWPTQPPVQWVLGVLSPGVKPPRREADHSPPGTASVATPCFQYMPSWHVTGTFYLLPLPHFCCNAYGHNCR
jgi:hypothetical protein